MDNEKIFNDLKEQIQKVELEGHEYDYYLDFYKDGHILLLVSQDKEWVVAILYSPKSGYRVDCNETSKRRYHRGTTLEQIQNTISENAHQMFLKIARNRARRRKYREAKGQRTN